MGHPTDAPVELRLLTLLKVLSYLVRAMRTGHDELWWRFEMVFFEHWWMSVLPRDLTTSCADCREKYLTYVGRLTPCCPAPLEDDVRIPSRTAPITGYTRDSWCPPTLSPGLHWAPFRCLSTAIDPLAFSRSQTSRDWRREDRIATYILTKGRPRRPMSPSKAPVHTHLFVSANCTCKRLPPIFACKNNRTSYDGRKHSRHIGALERPSIQTGPPSFQRGGLLSPHRPSCHSPRAETGQT